MQRIQRMYADAVHSTDGNEQLNLVRTFLPAEYYREVRIPPAFYYDGSDDTSF